MASRRQVRRLGRRRAGGVRPTSWPFGERPLWGTTPDAHPYGSYRSVRWGRLLVLILAWGLGLFAVMVVAALLFG
jgi:hypothetical protein